MASSKGPSVQEKEMDESFTNPNLPSIKHFRDVGKSINQIAKRQLLRENILFISTATTDASPSENDYLRNTLKIRTVIDTRWQNDRVFMPSPDEILHNQPPPSWLHIDNNLGLTHCGLKLRRGPYMDALSKELSFWQRTKLFSQAMLEDRARTGAMMSEVAQAEGATKESLRVLDASKVMIAEVWNKLFGQEASWPILLCQVRDSSTFVMVLLLFLEVPVEDVRKEIERSVIHAQSTVETPTDEEGRRFMESYVRSAGTWVGDVEEWMVNKYGGVEGYLKAAGVSSKAQDAVERILLVEAGEKLAEV